MNIHRPGDKAKPLFISHFFLKSRFPYLKAHHLVICGMSSDRVMIIQQYYIFILFFFFIITWNLALLDFTGQLINRSLRKMFYLWLWLMAHKNRHSKRCESAKAALILIEHTCFRYRKIIDPNLFRIHISTRNF